MSLFHVFIFFQELYVVLIFVLSECMEMVNSYVFVFFFFFPFLIFQFNLAIMCILCLRKSSFLPMKFEENELVGKFVHRNPCLIRLTLTSYCQLLPVLGLY